MAQSTEVQTPDAEKPKYLYPVAYRYYLIGQYALLGISIIVFGDFIFALILEVVHTVKTEDGFSFNARLLSDLGICAVFLAGVFFTHRHKERIREMVGNWAPLVFRDPVWVRTGVRDSSGEILDCKFEAEMTLWFSDSDSAREAEKFQGKIRDALKLFLEEASQDPVLRRSKNYLNDWINDSFEMADLQKIEIRTIKFYPAPRGADE
ncbi:MAG: hypothetical protein ISP41_17970 [Alphaproteobacteria bacterium]|jgi:hypothetical protein|nr:hypothetical protein [Alphaproteobacteria bacterium]